MWLKEWTGKREEEEEEEKALKSELDMKCHQKIQCNYNQGIFSLINWVSLSYLITRTICSPIHLKSSKTNATHFENGYTAIK